MAGNRLLISWNLWDKFKVTFGFNVTEKTDNGKISILVCGFSLLLLHAG